LGGWTGTLASCCEEVRLVGWTGTLASCCEEVWLGGWIGALASRCKRVWFGIWDDILAATSVGDSFCDACGAWVWSLEADTTYVVCATPV